MKFRRRVDFAVTLFACVWSVPLAAEVPSAPSSASTNAPPVPAAPSAPSPSAFPADNPAPIDPAKEAEIHKMMVLTGSEKSMDVVFDQIIAIERQRHPTLPQRFWADLDQEHKNLHAKMVERIVAIYDKYYTLDDLKAANAFYGSPAGQRMMEVKPQILKESLAAGKELGAEMAVRLSIKMMDYKQQMAPSTPATPSTNDAPEPTAPTPGAAPAKPTPVPMPGDAA